MNEINFLPASYIRQRAKRRRAMRHTATIALAVVAGVGYWTLERGQTAALRHEVERVEAEARAVSLQKTQSARLITEYKSLLHQTRVQRELAQPVTQTQVLAVLGKVLPSSVSLLQIEIAATRPSPAPAETEAKKSAKAKAKPKAGAKADPAAEPQFLRLTLQGLAPDDLTVANLIGLLSDHPLFGDVRLRHSRAVDVRGLTVRGFELTMRVDLQRDIQPRREEVAYAD